MKQKQKKAQLEMTETIFVVFIIIVIVVLGFVIYSKFQEESIKERQNELRDLKVVELANSISFWPELECSEAGGTSDFLCIDVTKLMVLGDFINKSQGENTYAASYYGELLSKSKITVLEIYPSFTNTPGKDYWEIWNKPGAKRTTDVVRVPVKLYNPLTKQYAFGVMSLQLFE